MGICCREGQIIPETIRELIGKEEPFNRTERLKGT